MNHPFKDLWTHKIYRKGHFMFVSCYEIQLVIHSLQNWILSTSVNAISQNSPACVAIAGTSLARATRGTGLLLATL